MAQTNGVIYSSSKSPQHPGLYSSNQRLEHGKKQNNRHLQAFNVKFSYRSFWQRHGRSSSNSIRSRESSFVCQSTDTQNTETKESVRQLDGDDCSNLPRSRNRKNNSVHGLAEACRYVYNDAKYVNERARNDLILLSRGIMNLDARARQDVSILGSGFLKLDARAREDTEKIDNDVKKRAQRLHHIAIIMKNKAETKIKKAAHKHWSDGALEADLRRADLLAKQRAMEDAIMALEFVKDIHDMMVSKMYKLTVYSKKGSLSANDMAERITMEKNGTTLDFFPWDVSTDRITAIQEAYWDIASALSDGDRIDHTDPEELELLVATLIDLDAMDGKSSASLLAECSSSPDVNTRKALANALSAAPSMWTLGNAGMGALQRLAEDSNPAIAAAATKTINELKKQWKIEEGDNWRFMMNKNPNQKDLDLGDEDDVEDLDHDDEDDVEDLRL